jgi:hypothetical protein
LGLTGESYTRQRTLFSPVPQNLQNQERDVLADTDQSSEEVLWVVFPRLLLQGTMLAEGSQYSTIMVHAKCFHAGSGSAVSCAFDVMS